MDFYEARHKMNGGFATLSFLIGDCLFKTNRTDSAVVYLKEALKLDSLCWEAKLDMMNIYKQKDDTVSAHRMADDLWLTAPWILDETYSSPGDIDAEKLLRKTHRVKSHPLP